MGHTRLGGEGVKAFLSGRTLKCFHPDTGDWAATIEYRADGTCHAAMADGGTDDGRYGFEQNLYWTQYSWFRGGGLFRFSLERIDDDTCQAYFDDGTTAFLQTVVE